MSSAGQVDITSRLKEFEGQPVGSGEVARDPVNAPMIRHWVEAMDDENPIYVDERAAIEAGHPGLVAPPTMLQAWGMKGLKPLPSQDGPTAMDHVMDLLNEAGFTSVVATNCEQTYDRYLRPGDELRGQSVIESISDLKKTGLGTGHFVTSRTDYTTRDGEHIGSMTFRILKFRPNPKEGTK